MTSHDSTGRRPAVPNPWQPPLPWWRYVVWFFLLLLFFWYWNSFEQHRQEQSFSYTEFKDKVRADQVAQVTLQGDHVSGMLRKPEAVTTADRKKQAAQPSPLHFVSTLPPVDDPGLIPRDSSEHTAELIDEGIVSLVGGIVEKVSSLLSSHRSCLEALAGALLENETLEMAEIQEIIARFGEVPQGYRPGADASQPRAHRGSARA